jgi:hypothetical protein
MSSLACFFALSEIPSRALRLVGDVIRGSNSSRLPSFVGIATKAAAGARNCGSSVSSDCGGGDGGGLDRELPRERPMVCED